MIKNKLAEYMGIKKIDKRTVTKISGIDRHTLNSLYHDNAKGIRFDTLDKLCFALDCTPNDILRYVPDKN